MWFCPACHKDLDDSVKNCPNCNLPSPSTSTDANTAAPANAAADSSGTTTSDFVIWRYSGKAFRAWAILNWIITLILVGLGIYLSVSGKMGEHQKIIWGIIIAIVAIDWIWFLVVYFYRTNFISYRLTEAHLYSEKGFFHRTIDTMELITINDLQMRQTLLDRLINGGVGTIEVHSPTDKTGTLKMNGMVNPQDVLEKIDSARRRLRGRGIVQI